MQLATAYRGRHAQSYLLGKDGSHGWVNLDDDGTQIVVNSAMKQNRVCGGLAAVAKLATFKGALYRKQVVALHAIKRQKLQRTSTAKAPLPKYPSFRLHASLHPSFSLSLPAFPSISSRGVFISKDFFIPTIKVFSSLRESLNCLSSVSL
jgi:hypothetical protein